MKRSRCGTRTGTEWENALLPPSGQNFCYGVWKEISHLTVNLHHLGFMYSPDGTLQASFTIDEIDTVAQNNRSYTGNFDFKVFDLSGNLPQEVKVPRRQHESR